MSAILAESKELSNLHLLWRMRRLVIMFGELFMMIFNPYFPMIGTDRDL